MYQELEEAANNGDLYEMRRILNYHSININATDDTNNNILMIYLYSRIDPSVMVRANDELDFITYLVFNTNLNINAQNIYGDTALMTALELYDELSYDIINILLRSEQINVNIQNDSGVSALMLAVSTGDPRAVRLILDAGANINLTDNDNFTAMDYAEDNNEITEMIIEASGEPEKYRTLKNIEIMESTILPYLNTLKLRHPFPDDIHRLISKNLLYPIDGKKRKSSPRKSNKRKSPRKKSIKRKSPRKSNKRKSSPRK